MPIWLVFDRSGRLLGARCSVFLWHWERLELSLGYCSICTLEAHMVAIISQLPNNQDEHLCWETIHLFVYFVNIGLPCKFQKRQPTQECPGTTRTPPQTRFMESLLLDPRMPCLSSGFPLVTPPKALSTMKAVILSFTVPSLSTISVLASTVKISAMPPFEIHICN